MYQFNYKSYLTSGIASAKFETWKPGYFPNRLSVVSSISYAICYFFAVLSGDRLSQMTRTYDDVRAVTHLLEEVSK